MAECDLSRLNPISFERLIRALAFAEFGPAGTTFSSGPDGARDFIYDGEIRGFEAKNWNGYLVVQAKFRDKLDGGKGDVDWLESQLDAELKKYSASGRGIKSPEYYIIATNVSLSGADGVTKTGVIRRGGHTKITERLTLWEAKIGLRGFHIWGADQVIDLLANQPEIRQTFAAWVTPGDVLTAMLSQIQASRPDFSQLIRRALKKRIVADQFVPLNEAGSVDNKKIQTSKVFIDLPVALARSGGQDQGTPAPGFVASVISVSKSKLDLIPVGPRSQVEASVPSIPSRLVLLGGPGQGKSTTGMFAVQLFRAAILRDDPEFALDPTICHLVPDILERAEQQALSTSLTRRFPVHVSLPHYADSVSRAKHVKEDTPSLLNYISAELGRAADGSVDRNDLRSWLNLYPWLLVLDGLDEVPPSGERPAVIEAIGSLVSEIADAHADVLLIVTSRPQGYNKDLDERHWVHWQLTDLPEAQATQYAHALSLAQHPFDADRRAKIAASLDRAMKQPATARLMISPLQVTIMHLIVDGGGSAPVGRWALFNEYYQVLKKREKTKGGETLEILERNWDHLDPVHNRAGLVLQTESETSGRAGANFNRPRLKQLIEGYLKSCGYTHESRELLSEELARLSLNRLVLLSTRQQGLTEDEGLISFDIRSLQEFMAAALLTTEADTWEDDPSGKLRPSVEDRLTLIAGMAHCRHVFLIAASRCFTETALNYLRSAVVSIPRSIDAFDADRIAGSGPKLALDMLIDGIGANHPISRTKLIEHALELLELGPDFIDSRLAEVWTPDCAMLFEDRLRAKLAEGTSQSALAAWKLLLSLCHLQNERFLPLAEEYWPSDARAGQVVVAAVGFVMPSLSLEQRALEAIKSAPPSTAVDSLWDSLIGMGPRSLGQQPKNFNLPQFEGILRFLMPERRNLLRIPLLPDISSQIAVSVCPMAGDEVLHLVGSIEGLHQGWAPIRAASEFARDPSAKALAAALRAIRPAGQLDEIRSFYGGLPWPIESLIESVTDDHQLEALANLAETGKFGDRDDWEAAESRWSSKGLGRSDLVAAPATAPFGEQIATVGSPVFRWVEIGMAANQITELVCELWRIRQQLVNKGLALNIAYVAQRAIWSGRRLPEASLVLEILEARTQFNGIDIRCLQDLEDLRWDDPATVQRLDKLFATYRYIHCFNLNDNMLTRLMEAYNIETSCRSLLKAIVRCIVNNPSQAPAALATLSPAAFQWARNDTASVRSAVAALNILKGGPISNEAVSALVADVRRFNGDLTTDVLAAENLLSRQRAEQLAVAVFRALHNAEPARASLLRQLLRKLLDARTSGLGERSTWVDRFRLPTDAFAVLTAPSADANPIYH